MIDKKIVQLLIYCSLIVTIVACNTSANYKISISQPPCAINPGDTIAMSVEGEIPAEAEVRWQAASGSFSQETGLTTIYTHDASTPGSEARIIASVTFDGKTISTEPLICAIKGSSAGGVSLPGVPTSTTTLLATSMPTAVIAITEPQATAVPTLENAPVAPSVTTGGGDITPPVVTSIVFNFEKDTQGWDTSERQYKLAELKITATITHEGQFALELTTELYGESSTAFEVTNQDTVYQHTETKVFFTQAAQFGMNIDSQYDMTGKRVSCFVYIPEQILPDTGPTGKVGMFVKDTQSRNNYDPDGSVTFNASTVGKWIQVIIDVGRGYSDLNFDKTQVNNFGVKFEIFAQSAIEYKGPIYIDDCTVTDSPK